MVIQIRRCIFLNISGQTQNNKNDYFNYQANAQGNKEMIYADTFI